jgi:hypothetical protein
VRQTVFGSLVGSEWVSLELVDPACDHRNTLLVSHYCHGFGRASKRRDAPSDDTGIKTVLRVVDCTDKFSLIMVGPFVVRLAIQHKSSKALRKCDKVYTLGGYALHP